MYALLCSYFKRSLCFKVDTPSPSPMETSGCAPAEEYLCQAFSDVLLAVNDVDAEDGADPNLCSEYVKDIYAYLRKLEVSIIRIFDFSKLHTASLISH